MAAYWRPNISCSTIKFMFHLIHLIPLNHLSQIIHMIRAPVSPDPEKRKSKEAKKKQHRVTFRLWPCWASPSS